NSVDIMKKPLNLMPEDELKKIRRKPLKVAIVDRHQVPVDPTPQTSFTPTIYTQHTGICIKGKNLYSSTEATQLLASTESSDTPTTDLQTLLIQLERHILTEAATKNYSEMCTCGFESKFKEGDYLFPEPLTYAEYLYWNKCFSGLWYSPYKEANRGDRSYADIFIPISRDRISSQKLVIPNHNLTDHSNYPIQVIDSILIGAQLLSQDSPFTQHYNPTPDTPYCQLFAKYQQKLASLIVNCLHNNIIKVKTRDGSTPNLLQLHYILNKKDRYDLTRLLKWIGADADEDSTKFDKPNWWERIYQNFINKCEDYTYEPTIFTIFFMSQLLQKPIVIWEKIEDGSLIYSKVCSPYFALLKQEHPQTHIEQWIHIAISADWETSHCLNFKDVMASLRPPE
ncbi:MAG: hypothetical protein WCJ17_04105, partial [bacterium]